MHYPNVTNSMPVNHDFPNEPFRAKVLVVFGTRPEAIKMAPLMRALLADQRFDAKLAVTGQHRQMLDQVLEFFELEPDFDLDVMRLDQSLCGLTAAILSGMNGIYANYIPDVVLVHGDTATTISASLASFYHRIPVAHVEAGLRTHNMYSPWPEEANRKLTAAIAELHFAPTASAAKNLLLEGVSADSITVTGNTVIDALLQTVTRIESEPILAEHCRQRFSLISPDKPVLLVTGHRRENFGGGFDRICSALIRTAQNFPQLQIVYPVHLNPKVKGPVEKALSEIPNIHLIEPQGYVEFVYLLNRASIVLSDSGGIQEEAPSLGKPVLVMRDETERPEAVEAGTVRLVGTNVEVIAGAIASLLTDESQYQAMAQAHNPYGDGQSCARILERLFVFVNAKKSKIIRGS